MKRGLPQSERVYCADRWEAYRIHKSVVLCGASLVRRIVAPCMPCASYSTLPLLLTLCIARSLECYGDCSSRCSISSRCFCLFRCDSGYCSFLSLFFSWFIIFVSWWNAYTCHCPSFLDVLHYSFSADPGDAPSSAPSSSHAFVIHVFLLTRMLCIRVSARLSITFHILFMLIWCCHSQCIFGKISPSDRRTSWHTYTYRHKSIDWYVYRCRYTYKSIHVYIYIYIYI